MQSSELNQGFFVSFDMCSIINDLQILTKRIIHRHVQIFVSPQVFIKLLIGILTYGKQAI